MTTVVEASRNDSREAVAQKKCMSCNHPYSFHGNGRSGCKAMGCKCEAWDDQDPWVRREHYAAVVNTLRAMEVSARLVSGKGSQPLVYVGGYVERPLVEGSETIPGDWEPPFAMWSNHGGAWAYSVLDADGRIADSGTNVMPHDTEPEEVARIVATWTYPPEGP
jgi:hypothetical protein